MYSEKIPYRNFKSQPQDKMVRFNLTGPEVFKLLVEFQTIFKWYETTNGGESRDLDTEEVIDFYTNFETILLAAWGELSEDGEHFRKAGKYDFEESALFAATMMSFVSDPPKVGKFLDDIMPSDMQEIVKQADASLAKAAENPDITPEKKDSIAELRRKLAEAEASAE